MKKIKALTSIFTLLLLTSCVKDVKDTIDSLECATLIARIDSDNENCADTIADIEKIEQSCGEFLTAENREAFAFIRANCTDN